MTESPSPLLALRQLAATQDGQFSTSQALGLGLDPKHLRRLAASGEIVHQCRGVWRFTAAGGSADPDVRALLQCLPDGVLSHRSAGRRHGIRCVDDPPLPEVTVAHGRRLQPEGVLVHQSRVLNAEDRILLGGVCCTTLERTIIDLADPANPRASLTVLDDGIAAGAKQRRVHLRAAVLAPGRPDARFIREATDPRSMAAFRSWLERAAAHVLRAAGIPDPAWNVPISDAVGRIGVVDALWRPWLVVAELEGMRFHTTPAQRRKDADRFNRLGDAVTAVKRFTWEDVVARPVHVAATVHRALRAAGADLDHSRIPRRIDLPEQPFQR